MTRGQVRARVVDELAAWLDDQPDRVVSRDDVDELQGALDDACEAAGDQVDEANDDGV